MEKTPPIEFKLEKTVRGKMSFATPLTGENTNTKGEKFSWNMYKFSTVGTQTLYYQSPTKGAEPIPKEVGPNTDVVFFAKLFLHKKLQELGDITTKEFAITPNIARDENGNIKEGKNKQPLTDYTVEIKDFVAPAPAVEEKEVNMEDIPF